MLKTPTTPGLYFQVARLPDTPAPLRTDIAGFLGRTQRGPVGRTVRVAGWQDFRRVFGGLDQDSDTTYAVRSYFDNGGDVAHIVRTAGSGAKSAWTEWPVGSLADGKWTKGSPAGGGFGTTRYRITAFGAAVPEVRLQQDTPARGEPSIRVEQEDDRSPERARYPDPGTWANRMRIEIHYRLRDTAGNPELDITVRDAHGMVETFGGIAPANVEPTIRQRSRLITIDPMDEVKDAAFDPARPGPATRSWVLELDGGADGPPARTDYLAAAHALGVTPEVALVASPDLHREITHLDDALEVLERLSQRADELMDRLVLVDVPGAAELAQDANHVAEFARALTESKGFRRRALAVYHPPLHVRDPLGGIVHPLRTIPPSGAVAGLISRLDRERGAHHTPANAPLYDVVDVLREYGEAERTLFHRAQVNVIRCLPGRGLTVWGGRTLDSAVAGRFVAHRRLIHRLVRAIRRVAEPLVFDTNGPELRLTLTRAITTVLLEAWRAGALKGARTDEAFQVTCDETNNPPEEIDLGRVLCEIAVAPAVPMEFIVLRIALSGEGRLEVFE